jgi:ubiquinone/menaquinone biosynthesis C-methylase UbiE
LERGSRLRAPDASGEVQELWFGLDVQALLTPYTELRRILEKLDVRDGQTVIDLGAAYGRMGFVMNRHFGGARFIGYEYVGERVEEGRRALIRFGAKSASLVHADLAGIKPASGDVYFIYDFGTVKAIEKTLHDLRRIAAQRPIRVVVRGRHCRYLIASRHSWLLDMFPQGPEDFYSIYASSLSLGKLAEAS